MRIIIAWGRDEEILSQVFPRKYFTSNTKIVRNKRMDWIIKKIMDVNNGEENKRNMG